MISDASRIQSSNSSSSTPSKYIRWDFKSSTFDIWYIIRLIFKVYYFLKIVLLLRIFSDQVNRYLLKYIRYDSKSLIFNKWFWYIIIKSMFNIYYFSKIILLLQLNHVTKRNYCHLPKWKGEIKHLMFLIFRTIIMAFLVKVIYQKGRIVWCIGTQRSTGVIGVLKNPTMDPNPTRRESLYVDA